jgi:Skp family chaperone for outer membrane proteins
LKSLYLPREEFKDTQNKNIKMIEDSAWHYRKILNAEINKMVFLFRRNNNYKYLFHPVESGNFMFADSSLDITKKVVIYLKS